MKLSEKDFIDMTKLKNLQEITWLRTQKGCPGLYRVLTDNGEDLLVIFSKENHYKKRKEEFNLFKRIHRYNKEASNALFFKKIKNQVCTVLEWKENIFMQKIVYYYSNNE